MNKSSALILSVSVLLSGCLTAEVMHLSSGSADSVMNYIRDSDPTATFPDAFTLSCTVTEGNFCDVTDLPAELPRDLSKQVIQEVGPKYVEHSKNNTVQIRCAQRSAGLLRTWNCEIDRGGGWQSLPVP
ncbi:hypothetical protein TFLX_00066 [Thermoflexales bacterium]|nr:hypothetical protein TFLX_00066 [Thermoflexales bacterium]